MIAVNGVEIPSEFVDICESWHGGSSSMFYAVCSTGNLKTGTHRPYKCKTDQQWYLHLWRQLSSEVSSTLRMAEKREVGEDDENDVDDVDVLTRFEAFAEKTVAELEASYNLADWEED